MIIIQALIKHLGYYDGTHSYDLTHPVHLFTCGEANRSMDAKRWGWGGTILNYRRTLAPIDLKTHQDV